jgi:predicted AAA+ superfamily ATPase
MSNEKTFNRDVRGLVSARQELSLDNGLIITWDTEQLLEQNIMVLPVWKWLLSGDNTD